MFSITSVLLAAVVAWATTAVSMSSKLPETTCDDWGESMAGPVLVLEAEAGWLSCPLFFYSSVYNYSLVMSSGHNLVWYWVPEGQDMEQPVPKSWRFSRDRDRLWLHMASVSDTGQYICLLRNKSSCSKMATRLKVLHHNETARRLSCEPAAAVAAPRQLILLQKDKILECPGLHDAERISDAPLSVTWYHGCLPFPRFNHDYEQIGTHLEIHSMYEEFDGSYYCTISFRKLGRSFNFTRTFSVISVLPAYKPRIIQPQEDDVHFVRLDTNVKLVCKGAFPHLESPQHIWWSIDGKRVEQLANQRISETVRNVFEHKESQIKESLLLIQNIQAEDLRREYNCSMQNEKGNQTRRFPLREEVSPLTVELGCGLGVTLALMLLLFVVYHIFRLELQLLYRSWFGTDERHTDNKEYDVYISYARNSEEEQFVLSTLRRVLENDFGYSVCIFDRDSLPGGNLPETIVLSMLRSQRLLFVLGPDFLVEKSFSLLECRLGLYLHRGRRASIVTVVRCSVGKQAAAEAAQLRQAAVATVTWRGSRSEPRHSRFWLRLRLALPIRPLALGHRLIDSASSHSDVASPAPCRDATNRSRGGVYAPPAGRGRAGPWSKGTEAWQPNIRICSRCTGVCRRVDARGVELRDHTPPAGSTTITPPVLTESALPACQMDS